MVPVFDRKSEKGGGEREEKGFGGVKSELKRT